MGYWSARKASGIEVVEVEVEGGGSGVKCGNAAWKSSSWPAGVFDSGFEFCAGAELDIEVEGVGGSCCCEIDCAWGWDGGAAGALEFEDHQPMMDQWCNVYPRATICDQ